MEFITTFAVLTFVISIRTCICEIPSESVKNLYDSLLTGYNTRIRPTKDQNKTTEIISEFRPSLLVGLDTTNQKLSLISYFTFIWKDEFIVWNSSDYHGKETVQLRIDDIWHPTMKLGPSHDSKSIIGHEDDKVLVDSSGMVHWGTEGLFSIVCQIDVTYYPFDTQTCDFHMYISDEVSTDVVLSFDSISTSAQFKTENGEWKVIGVNTSLYYIRDTALINHRLKLERRAEFSLYTSILPLMLLFFLNTFVLLVPVCSGEKGSIAITFLLSFSVYISSISAYLPTNSLQTPLVLTLMIIMLIQSSLILLVAIEQSRLYHHGNSGNRHKSLWYNLLCCSRLKPPVETETEDKGELNGELKPTETTFLKCADKVMFGVAFVLNVTISLSFAFVIKFERA